VGRSDSERSQAWIDRQLDKIQHALRAMSFGLGDKAFCSGIHMSLSDIAVGCAVGYLDFRFPQIDCARPVRTCTSCTTNCHNVRVSSTACLLDETAGQR
jgi:glutathione S-transferase